MKSVKLFYLIVLLVFSPLVAFSGDNQTLKLLGHNTSKYNAFSNFPDSARISEKVFGLKGLSNVGRVSPMIYRGAQPLPEGYATLSKMGIKTVINLRYTHSEKKVVESAGMKSIEIPINTFKRIDSKTVSKVVRLMTDPENQPVYVHCKLGQDRTGMIIAIYRMSIEGWALAEAEDEMQDFGFNDVWYHIKDYVREFALQKNK